MESAFGRLYRTSKLASFDPKIKQVYTAYSAGVAKGDWGLKRTVPPKVKTRMVTIGSLDTKEQITTFKSANQDVMIVNSWMENFPESKSPGSAADTRYYEDFNNQFATDSDLHSENTLASGTPRNICMMTPNEWKAFLDEARSRRAEWKQALADGKFTSEETLTFMNATNIRNSSMSGVHNSPTYHDYTPVGNEIRVNGRVLNRTTGGYSVGIQGIVAFLPLQNGANEEGFQYRDVKTFYVVSAKFDNKGRPDVVLSTRPPGAREASLVYSTSSGSGFGFDSTTRRNKDKLQTKFLDQIKNIMLLNNSPKGKNKEDSTPTESSDAVTNAIDILNKYNK